MNIILPDVGMVKSPAEDMVIDILSGSTSQLVERQKYSYPSHDIICNPMKLVLTVLPEAATRLKTICPGIIGVMPGHGDTERPVTHRIPIAATLGGRTVSVFGKNPEFRDLRHDIIHADTNFDSSRIKLHVNYHIP